MTPVEFVAIPGGQIELRRIPGLRPDSPVIVFLHEALGSVSHWRDFPARLCAQTGTAGLVYSRFGHGQSSPLVGGIPRPMDFCLVEARQVLPVLLAKLGIVRPYLVSHSDGASIALLAAAKIPLAGITAMAPHLHIEDITARGAQQAGRHRDFFVGALAKYHRQPDRVFDAWHQTTLSPAFRYWNLEPEMSDIRCPTLLIQGLRDEYGSLAHVARTQAAINRAHPAIPVRRLDMPGVAHVPWREARDDVIAAIAGHLQASLPGQARSAG